MRKVLLTIPLLLGAIFPMAAQAVCCKCIKPTDPKVNICINTTTITDCPSLKIASLNASIKTLDCQAFPEGVVASQCQPVANGGVCSFGPTDELAYGSPPPLTSTETFAITAPTLGISIPKLTFVGNLVGQDGYLQIPWLAQYIVAVQKYLIGISIVAAAIMIVYGGFRYIVGASMGSVSAGKTIIKDAVIGLILIFSSYLILVTINPATTTLDALKVSYIVKKPFYDFLEQNGTGEPVASQPVIDAVARTQGVTQISTPSPSEDGTPETQTIPPIPPLAPGEEVRISDIPFSMSLGGAGNLALFCHPKSREGKAATTYQEKIKLLVRTVLGFHQVCVKQHQCVYCQGCYTNLSSGKVSLGSNPDFMVKQCQLKGINACYASVVWADQPECIEAYHNTSNPYAVNLMSACRATAGAAFQEHFVNKFEKGNVYATDCGGFAFFQYQCAGPDFKLPPRGKNNSYYYDTRDLELKSNPNMVLAAHMDADLPSLAAEKGGIKFGDLIYTCCAIPGVSSNHWFMYTGGRSDVPFSFIEMGGRPQTGGEAGGASVPTLGWYPGVNTLPPNWTIIDYLDMKKKDNPKMNPKLGGIWVWRPYDE